MRELMENYWIVREKDRELYTQVKREIPKYRRFFTEQLGWNLIQNERIIKLEKIPARAESFMGIEEFTEVRDYCIFCAVLIFLEDKEDGEQFLLSELVSMIEAQLQEYMEIDWTMYIQRKSLVRVLKFAEKMQLLEVYDGTSNNITGGIEHEVLYENTGLSRYFSTNFGYSISEVSSYEDFEKEQVAGLETDRGHFRIQRVYRQLVSSPAMYWDFAEDQDSLYLKNQRQWVGKYLDENLGAKLHIHKNAAFCVLEEEDCFGEYHPREATISEVTLNICSELRSRVKAGRLKKESNDCIILSRDKFFRILLKCKEKYSCAWSKEFREMKPEKLIDVLIEYMQSWMMVKKEADGTLIFYPSIGKLTGSYPKEFLEREVAKK